MESVKRFGVYHVCGDTKKEMMQGVIISPDEMNACISTVIFAPMVECSRNYPTRIPFTFKGKKSQIALDQIRTIDKSTLTEGFGVISVTAQKKLLNALNEMFAP